MQLGRISHKMRFSTVLALVSSSSSQLFNMHFGRTSRRMASFCRCSASTLEGCLVQNAFSRDSGRTKCCVFRCEGWFRTWEVKLWGTTARIILGSCVDHARIVRPLQLEFSPVFCVRAVDGIPLCFATLGWFLRWKCDCKCCSSQL